MTTEFVQIGNTAFNPAQIVTIDFGSDKVWVDLVASGETEFNAQFVFEGSSARAFRVWWSKTNVSYFEPEWYEEEENGNN